MLGDGDTNPPDDGMLKRVSELMVYAQSHGEYLLDIVYGHYLLASDDPDWLESCGVPLDLTRDTVAGFLRETAVSWCRVTSIGQNHIVVQYTLFRCGTRNML